MKAQARGVDEACAELFRQRFRRRPFIGMVVEREVPAQAELAIAQQKAMPGGKLLDALKERTRRDNRPGREDAVQREWIDPSRLESVIRTLIDGGGQTGADVLRVLRLEQWLASRHRRGPAAIPRGKEVTTNAVLNA